MIYHQVSGAQFAIINNLPTADGKKCRAVVSLSYPYMIYRLYMYNPNDKGEGRRVVEIDRHAVPDAVQHPDGLRLYAAPMGVAVGTFYPESWHGASPWSECMRREAAAALRWYALNGLESTERYNLAKPYIMHNAAELEASVQHWEAVYAERNQP